MKTLHLLRAATLVLTLNATPLAAATHIVGNGGDGVVCDGTDDVQVLDLFEARAADELTIDLGPATLEPAAKVELALTRLERLDAPRAHRYRDIAALFLPRLSFSSRPVNDLDDAGPVALPDGCRLVQLAAQFTLGLSWDDLFWLIDKALWQRLSSDDKAGLLLHEIVYYDALRYGHPTSAAARRLTGLLSAAAMETMSVAELRQQVTDLGLDQVVWHDQAAGVQFVLLEPVPSAAAAAAACAALTMPNGKRAQLSVGIVDAPQLDRLRASFIGTYYLSRLGSLFLWVDARASGRPLQMIGEKNVVWPTPRPQTDYAALCIAPE